MFLLGWTVRSDKILWYSEPVAIEFFPASYAGYSKARNGGIRYPSSSTWGLYSTACAVGTFPTLS
ncbi:hypothetical protein D3C76_1734540 [compost metagenome]